MKIAIIKIMQIYRLLLLLLLLLMCVYVCVCCCCYIHCHGDSNVVTDNLHNLIISETRNGYNS